MGPDLPESYFCGFMLLGGSKMSSQLCCFLHESTDLHFEQPAAVRLEVTVVNLAHRVHVLVSDLLCNCSLVGQKELVEEPTARPNKRSECIGCVNVQGVNVCSFLSTIYNSLFTLCFYTTRDFGKDETPVKVLWHKTRAVFCYRNLTNIIISVDKLKV